MDWAFRLLSSWHSRTPSRSVCARSKTCAVSHVTRWFGGSTLQSMSHKAHCLQNSIPSVQLTKNISYSAKYQDLKSVMNKYTTEVKDKIKSPLLVEQNMKIRVHVAPTIVWRQRYCFGSQRSCCVADRLLCSSAPLPPPPAPTPRSRFLPQRRRLLVGWCPALRSAGSLLLRAEHTLSGRNRHRLACTAGRFFKQASSSPPGS